MDVQLDLFSSEPASIVKMTPVIEDEPEPLEAVLEALATPDVEAEVVAPPPCENTDQSTMFGEWFEEHWKGMPEFVQHDLQPYRTLFVHFEKPEDIQAFSKLLDQPITGQTKFLWYPKAEFVRAEDKRYIDQLEAEQRIYKDQLTDMQGPGEV